MVEPDRRDWLDGLMFVGSLLAFSLSLLGLLVLLIMAGISSLRGDPESVLINLANAAAVLIMGICCVPALLLSGRAFLGSTSPKMRPPPRSWVNIFILYPIALGLGYFAFNSPTQNLILGPLAHVTAAAAPIAAIIIFLLRVNPQISVRRMWGQFLAGLWASPLLALALEIGSLIPVILIAFVVNRTNPSAFDWLSRFVNFDSVTEPSMNEALLELFRRPWVILLIVGFVAVLVPLIEEAVKTIAVWPLIRRKITVQEAFLGGALAGAGYALFEAFFLVQPGPTWSVVMLARVGASLIHTFTAALASMGLVKARNDKSFRTFLLTFGSAVGLHGLWNITALSLSLGISVGEVGLGFLQPQFAPWIIGVALLVLIGLSAIALVGLMRVPTYLKRNVRTVQELSGASPSEGVEPRRM